MLPDEVRKAVEWLDEKDRQFTGPMHIPLAKYKAAWRKARAHLLAREAEVDAVSTELRTMRGEFAKQFKRAERAEADLEAANKAVDTYREMLVSITARIRWRKARLTSPEVPND